MDDLRHLLGEDVWNQPTPKKERPKREISFGYGHSKFRERKKA